MNKKQITALLLGVVLCITLAFSYAFILTEADHDCTGEHCEICIDIQHCLSFFKTLVYAGAAVAALVFAIVFFASICSVFDASLKTITLVTLKVKLLI